MPTIQCGNCGATHGSVAEVRRCHTTRPGPAADDAGPVDDAASDQFDDAPFDQDEEAGDPMQPGAGPIRSARLPRPEPRSATAPRRPATPVPGAGRGPERLGRSVVVGAGDAPPDAWRGCTEVRVDATGPLDPGTIGVLHEAWLTRTPTIIRLSGDVPDPRPIAPVDPWVLDPSLDLLEDRLAFLLTANAVDARTDAPTWELRDLAVARGASPATGDADIVVDGRPHWLDGGPFCVEDDLDLPVVHRTGVLAGSLTAVRHVSSPAELAPDQLAAVHHAGGPARIIAPAGSGKTRVLTERARHLLADRGAPPGALTLVAFNKRAQLEMQERTTDLAGLQVRTLNALGLAIVRGTSPFVRSPTIPRPVEVITERDVRRLLDELLDLRRRANTDQLAPWLEALTAVRLGLRDPAEVERSFGGDVDGLADLVVRYRDTLRERDVVDFDEQIVRAIDVLLADPYARRVAQQTCQLLLVDEFQDLTPAHLLLVRLLATPELDVFGVGDDDQTIYGFTGASPDWLIDYRRWFPGAASHPLEVNYRCPPAVVHGAATLLTHNLRRVEKVIRPAPGRVESASGLEIVEAPDAVAAATGRIADLLDAGASPPEVVALTRVNAALAPVQVALRVAGVPVERAVDTTFLARSGVRAVLAWLRLVTGDRPFAPGDLEAAARRPSRGLAPRVVGWLTEQRDLRNVRRLAARLERDHDKIAGFADDLQRLTDAAAAGIDTAGLIETIRDDLGLASSLDALDASRRTVDRSSHGDDLAALLGLARLQPDPARFEPWLTAHLDAPGDPDGVRISTVHRVKGREWPHVVVVGVDVGSFPHRLAEDVEEERRVFHVACTRASTSTTVVATAGAASPFVGQLTTARDPDAPIEPPPRRTPPTAGSAAHDPADGPLREALRTWRRERSQADGVPAYVVFNDRTLDELVSRRPADLRDLARCHGIGPAKLDRFGDELLGVIEAAT